MVRQTSEIDVGIFDILIPLPEQELHPKIPLRFPQILLQKLKLLLRWFDFMIDDGRF